jgi:hypothetical protein
LPDYEGILIGSRFKKIKKAAEAKKKVDCVVINLKVNLYSSTAIDRHGNYKLLKVAVDEVKNERRRPVETS